MISNFRFPPRAKTPPLFFPPIQRHSTFCVFTSIYNFFLVMRTLKIYSLSNFLLFFSFSSVQFSRSVVSDSLQLHESQHTRPPCPSPTPGVHSNSRPSSRWCHPAISSSVVPFSSCPPIPPSIRVFSNESTLLLRWPNYWSLSFSIIPSKEHPGPQGWSPLEWTGWISLQSKGLSRVFSNTTVQKNQFFGAQLSSQSNSHIHTWPLEKP